MEASCSSLHYILQKSHTYAVFHQAMNNNHREKENSKVLYGNQKSSKKKIDSVGKFYWNSTKLQCNSEQGNISWVGCLEKEKKKKANLFNGRNLNIQI